MSDERSPARPWYDLVMEKIAIKGWGVAELARRAKVGRPTIYGWRDNPGKPQSGPVNAVADVLGIDRRRANELAGVLVPARESSIPPDVLAVIRKRYSPEQQREAIEMLESLSGPPEEEESERQDGDGYDRAG